jgi:hypothetical protein
MKKSWIAIIAALIFLSLAVSSCHISEPVCPAYAKKEQKNSDNES